jgi:hypothetical protein
MAMKKPRPKVLRCPSCRRPIEQVYILHTTCERWTLCKREDGTLSAYRRYDTTGDTEYVELDCGCNFSEEHIQKVRPILQALEAIEE